jgi:hypothetical protein
LISHFAGQGTPTTPRSVEETVARRPGAGEAYRSPTGLGETESCRVITLIEAWAFSSLDEIVQGQRTMPGVYVPEEWYLHARLLRDLGSGWERRRAIEKRP